uniref:Helicase ATP-binding domain-containing protein n=1 Tax=Parascaris univalens TaxID=6257 RepID=A0A915C674_PARUN
MVRRKATPAYLPSIFAINEQTSRTSGNRYDEIIHSASSHIDDTCVSRHNAIYLPSFYCYWQAVRTAVHCFVGSVHASIKKVLHEGSFPSTGRLVCVVCKNCRMIKIARRYIGSKKKRTIREDFFEASYNDEESEEFIAMTRRMIFCKNFFTVVFSHSESIIEMQIYLSSSILNNPSVSTLSYPAVNNVIAHFFPQRVQKIEEEKIFEPRKKEDCKGFLRLLSHVRPTYKDWKLSLSSIVPVLRPYQMDAVRFMISREVEPDLNYSSEDFFVQIPTNPPFYFALYTGAIFDSLPRPFEVPPGGILADEMGLGKTVELLGLIVSHRRGEAPTKDPDPIVKRSVIAIVLEEIISTVVAGLEANLPRCTMTRKRSWDLYYNEIEDESVKKRSKMSKSVNVVSSITCLACGVECSQAKVFWDRFDSSAIPFCCPNCIQKQENKKAIKATLVIAPSTICHQWYEEVKRHVRDDVVVDIYNGVAAEGYKHPEYLATRDIVICSFETLASEVYFIETNEKLASLRRRKYLIPPTPLLSVEWWRVCVDEAQVIESRTSVVSEMCWRLQAVNRWCITGTPITDSVDNLFGLLRII